MASFTYDIGSYQIQNGSLLYLTDTIKIMLVGTATPYTGTQTDASMTAAASSELSVTGYTGGFAGAGRQTLASKTITNDTTNNRTSYGAANPSAWTLSTGGTVAAAIVYKHITSDAASVPIFFLDFTDVPTNGSTFTLSFPGGLLGYTQQ